MFLQRERKLTMNRHDVKIICASVAATLVCTLSANTVLADTPLKDSIKSYGVFQFDYDQTDNQNDIVIDSNDLITLANEIDSAKNNIGVVGKNLNTLVDVFDSMDEQGKNGKLYGTAIDSTDAGITKIENAFANGVGDATDSKVLKGYSFTSQYGLNIPGTIESLSAATITPGTKDQTLKAGFYLKGTQTIKGDTNLIAGNILKGKSIFGVNGTVIAEANSSAHTVPTGKTAVSAPNILAGKTGWNGSSWVDGTMVDKSSTTTAASTVSEDGANAKIQIPASGFYNKDNSYISVPIETLKNNVSALNSSSVYYLGTGTSFDVSNIPRYQNLTKDNFIVCACSLSGSGTGGYYFNSVTESTNFSMPTVTPTVTYSNGKLTITNTSTSGSAGGGSPSSFGRASASLSNIKVYLVIGDIKQP